MIKQARAAIHREALLFAAYYAPRGRQRLYMVAAELSRKYLTPGDLLIGILGAEGSGKSTLIRGLFPGLELTNDDEGINLRPTPLLHFDPQDAFSGHTFHLDARYELAFRQRYELAEAVRAALDQGRRVIVEHFDLLHEALGSNADVLFGIGEEIIVARPTIFGPRPEAIKAVVDRTIRNRLMAHSAEDLTCYVLQRDYKLPFPPEHSDVRQGFVLNFRERPPIDLEEVERKVLDLIARDVPIAPCGESALAIGDAKVPCTGTRTHVTSTGKIENFRLVKEYRFDLRTREYYVIGLVGTRAPHGFEDLMDLWEIED